MVEMSEVALTDYWLCDLCGAKTFYSADLEHDGRRHDEVMLPTGVGDMRAICPKCAKTYKVTVQKHARAVTHP